MKKILKNLSLFILVIVMFLTLLYLLPDNKTKDSKDNFESNFNDVYLYEYEYRDNEIANKDKSSKFYLYIVSLEVVDGKNIDRDKVEINIPGIENSGKRYKELEEDIDLTEKIFKERVEVKNNKIYSYYIIQTKTPIDKQNLRSINIHLEKNKCNKNIDAIMQLV